MFMSEEQAVVTPSETSTAEANEPIMVNGTGNYGEDNVQIFRDTAHIRQRPSMYIGNTSSSGLHHLVYELVYNSVDEALAGYCRNIQVKIDVDRALASATTAAGFRLKSTTRPNGQLWKLS